MRILVLLLLLSFQVGNAQDTYKAMIDAESLAVEEQMIEWRKWFHENPELSNREFNTAKKIAEILKSFGLEPVTGIAKTGVVAVLDSGKPGPFIGLRADIDGLPVRERADVPYKSTKETTFLGNDVGIMHACGHDTHISMLLATAKILTENKDKLKGKVLFIFQPAEEGAPPGEEGGAALMIKEGLLEKYPIEVIFGQHIWAPLEEGTIFYKAGGIMAAAQSFTIKVKGKQAHGSRPWSGIDPIVTSAQIIMGLQTIISRQTNLTKEAAVITIGKISGGVRSNIIPEEVEMIGTIRTLDPEMKKIINEKIIKTATLIAEAQGATAEVNISDGVPVTYNNPALTKKMLPSLFSAIGEENVFVTPAVTGAEDFSFYAKEVPGLFFFVGGRPKSVSQENATSHHTPDFLVAESALITGVKAMTTLTMNYMYAE